MTTILGGELADERRAPARHEAVCIVQRRQAGKAGVDDPKLLAREREFVNADVAGHVAGTRQNDKSKAKSDRNQGLRVLQAAQAAGEPVTVKIEYDTAGTARKVKLIVGGQTP